MNRPFVYKKIESHGDLQKIYQISQRGYKYLSRLNAAGELTLNTLKNVKKASCIKEIRSINFDP